MWKGVYATLQSDRYTLSYPRGRNVTNIHHSNSPWRKSLCSLHRENPWSLCTDRCPEIIKRCSWYLWGRILYELRYIVGFGLVEMAISTNLKPTIYHQLYDNTAPGVQWAMTLIYILNYLLYKNAVTSISLHRADLFKFSQRRDLL